MALSCPFDMLISDLAENVNGFLTNSTGEGCDPQQEGLGNP